MAGKPPYLIDAIATWEINGRKGRGMSADDISEKMENEAVLQKVVPVVQQHFRPNRRGVHLVAAALYEWYRSHAIAFPGYYIHHLDVHIVHSTSGMIVAKIDVSSGGIVELCHFRS